MVDAVKNYLKTASWKKQHTWRRALWKGMSRVGLTGVHGLPLHRRWIDLHRRKMPLPNLDPAHVGMRVVQISDIHYSPVVWKRYLLQYVEWVNATEPDVIVITGDLITGGYRYAKQVAEILADLRAPLGVICTFGNHDYGMLGKAHRKEGARRADFLEDCLQDCGMIVLRNQTLDIRKTKTALPLRIVGLDDEWSGAMNPEAAFAGITDDASIICLNHNPANVLELIKYPWQWMLAGHTHGRQLGHTRLGRVFNAKRYRHYTHGYYAVQGKHLYVNRGLSYGQRVLDWCRPEVTVFSLTHA